MRTFYRIIVMHGGAPKIEDKNGLKVSKTCYIDVHYFYTKKKRDEFKETLKGTIMDEDEFKTDRDMVKELREAEWAVEKALRDEEKRDRKLLRNARGGDALHGAEGSLIRKNFGRNY